MKGKVEKSETTVDYIGWHKEIRRLAAEAGLIDPELEAVVDKLTKAEAQFTKLKGLFGATGRVVKA